MICNTGLFNSAALTGLRVGESVGFNVGFSEMNSIGAGVGRLVGLNDRIEKMLRI